MPSAARKRGRPEPTQEGGTKAGGCRRSTRLVRTTASSTGTAVVRQPKPDGSVAAAAAIATVGPRDTRGDSCETFNLQGSTGKLRFWPSLLSSADQERLFQELSLDPNLLPGGGGGGGGGGGDSGVGRGDERGGKDAAGGRWMQRPIKLFGKEILQPRLTCFYGQQGITYRYSGKTLEATPWESVPAIQEILKAAERAAEVSPGYFNCVLLNWYRDGSDYMGWHSDDEKELDKGAAIASVSLGTERRFQLRRKTNHTQQMEFMLHGGSLLLMEGTTQEYWQHRVPKRSAKESREFRDGVTTAAAAAAAAETAAASPSATAASVRLLPAEQAEDGSGVLAGAGGGSSDGGTGSGGRGNRGRVLPSAAGVAQGGEGRINLTFRRVERGRCP